MPDNQTASTTSENTAAYAILTPAGVFEAFSHNELTDEHKRLQSLLSNKQSWSVAQWTAQHGQQQFDAFVEAGWVEVIDRMLTAPNMPLDKFLPYVVVSLSGDRQAAIGSSEGFCLARVGFDSEAAERLCVAGADFYDFLKRQQQRGLVIKEKAMSFFHQIDLLMPSTSFIFLNIDDVVYVLILQGEPLTNNQAFVELIWAIKTSGLRFNRA